MRPPFATMSARLRHRGPDDEFLVSGRRISRSRRAGSASSTSRAAASRWRTRPRRSGRCRTASSTTSRGVRERLVAAGHRLHTHCDTEILPHLYEQHGAGLPEHIDGMFAVAVWDDERSDRPARARPDGQEAAVLPASTATRSTSRRRSRRCSRFPGFERRLDLEALHHYLSYKHVPHPLSIFERIRAAAARHRARLRAWRGARRRALLAARRSRRGEQSTKRGRGRPSCSRCCRQGVRRRLMGDVPIGFFLSGGIDSSLSTALAAEMSPGPIKTFTLTYGEGSSTDGKEQRPALGASCRRALRHRAPRGGDRLPALPGHDPADPAQLRRAVRRRRLDVLPVRGDRAARQGRGVPATAPTSSSAATSRTGSPAGGRSPATRRLLAVRDSRTGSGVRAVRVRRGGEATLSTPRDTRRGDARLRHTRHLRATAFAGLTATDPLNRMLEAEFRTILPDQVLTFVDRLSMAHSLEVRTAFLDTAVVEYVASLPGSLKIRDGETKYLLKRAAERYFPTEMAFRPKEGFVMPVTDWLLARSRAVCSRHAQRRRACAGRRLRSRRRRAARRRVLPRTRRLHVRKQDPRARRLPGVVRPVPGSRDDARPSSSRATCRGSGSSTRCAAPMSSCSTTTCSSTSTAGGTATASSAPAGRNG